MKTPILTDLSCAVCAHKIAQRNGEAVQMFCRRFPPTVTIVMSPGPKGVIPVPLASFPPVQAEMVCGEFKRRVLHGHASATAGQA